MAHENAVAIVCPVVNTHEPNGYTPNVAVVHADPDVLNVGKDTNPG